MIARSAPPPPQPPPPTTTTTTTLRSHFGSSRDRLPGFRLGSFISVGSVQGGTSSKGSRQVPVDISLMCFVGTQFGGVSVAPSLQHTPEGTGLFDLVPSQDETKDGFHNSMVLVSCVVVLMSLLPGLVDVLPSVRRSVMTCARPCLTLGSVVVCAAAMAAALLYTIVFSFSRLRFVWWARPFLEWPCPAGCVAVRVHSISRLVWMLFSNVSWSMRREI